MAQNAAKRNEKRRIGKVSCNAIRAKNLASRPSSCRTRSDLSPSLTSASAPLAPRSSRSFCHPPFRHVVPFAIWEAVLDFEALRYPLGHLAVTAAGNVARPVEIECVRLIWQLSATREAAQARLKVAPAIRIMQTSTGAGQWLAFTVECLEVSLVPKAYPVAGIQPSSTMPLPMPSRACTLNFALVPFLFL